MQPELNLITVPNLKETEKFLIWSIREWIISIMRAKDPRPEIIKCFSKLLIQEAVIPFDKMMRIIGYNCCVPIDVRCHCSNLLGRTEIDQVSEHQNTSHRGYTDRCSLGQQNEVPFLKAIGQGSSE